MSREAEVLPVPVNRRLVSVRLRADAPARPAPEDPRIPATEVKELQRKAFERGRAVEAAEWTHRFSKLLEQLGRAQRSLEEAREEDRRDAETFAARLAALAAEKLLRVLVDDGRYDVVSMVRAVLDEIGFAASGPGVKVRMHPDDHAALAAALRAEPGQVFAGGIEWAADPAVPKASFDVSAGGTEFYAHLAERLEVLRALWVEESRHRD
jgi:hypothetical protein